MAVGPNIDVIVVKAKKSRQRKRARPVDGVRLFCSLALAGCLHTAAGIEAVILSVLSELDVLGCSFGEFLVLACSLEVCLHFISISLTGCDDGLQVSH